MKGNHKCPVAGCAVIVRGSLMCPAHWALVSRATGAEVWRWYRQIENGQLTPMYLEAALAAIVEAEREERIAAAAGNPIQQNLL